jgi:hypothetical protein
MYEPAVTWQLFLAGFVIRTSPSPSPPGMGWYIGHDCAPATSGVGSTVKTRTTMAGSAVRLIHESLRCELMPPLLKVFPCVLDGAYVC